MTVRDLIARLKVWPQDWPVRLDEKDGIYWTEAHTLYQRKGTRAVVVRGRPGGAYGKAVVDETHP